MELALDFDDRPYKLGETIRLTVEMDPNGSVDVREARIDLVCQQRYSERSTVTYEKPIRQVGGAETGIIYATQVGTETVTKQVNKQHNETFVHSSIALLSSAKIDAPRRLSVDLEAEQVPPPRAEDAKDLVKDRERSWSFKWTLVLTVDVVRGRNPKKQRRVRISFD